MPSLPLLRLFSIHLNSLMAASHDHLDPLALGVWLVHEQGKLEVDALASSP